MRLRTWQSLRTNREPKDTAATCRAKARSQTYLAAVRARQTPRLQKPRSSVVNCKLILPDEVSFKASPAAHSVTMCKHMRASSVSIGSERSAVFEFMLTCAEKTKAEKDTGEGDSLVRHV